MLRGIPPACCSGTALRPEPQIGPLREAISVVEDGATALDERDQLLVGRPGGYTQSIPVEPAHPQHALRLKAGCGFGLGDRGLESPGRCLQVREAINFKDSFRIPAEASPSNSAAISCLSAVLA